MITIKFVESEKIDEGLMQLLLLADPSRSAVDMYLQEGECFEAIWNEQRIGVCVLKKEGRKSEVELMNISIDENFQNKGYGQQVISAIIAECRNRGIEKITLGTGNSSIGQLYFYQKCGFEMCGIVRDFFTENYEVPIFEHGLQCKHMVRFEMKLKP